MNINRSQSLSGFGISIGGVSQTVAVEGGEVFDGTIAASQTNVEVSTPDVDLTTCSVMAIVADKDCTVKTNSTSAPDDTLALKANIPLTWITGDLADNKFLTADVTKWYVTTGAAATKLKILIGSDPTP